MAFHKPSIDINRVWVLVILFIPVILWTGSDITGVKLSKNTEEAIKLWTFFAAGIVGINYMSGPSVVLPKTKKDQSEDLKK